MKLLNVEQLAKKFPDFKIIPREELKKIKKGSLVKVMIKNERFWVEISKVMKGGKYEGLISNYLVSSKKYKYGDKIKLNDKNILTIEGYKNPNANNKLGSYLNKIKDYFGLDEKNDDDGPVAVAAGFARP